LALAAWLTLAAAALAAAPGRWDLGGADARLLEAGYRQDPRSQAWSAEVTLRLVNRDRARPFHRQVQVEFAAAGAPVWAWKMFVSLAPGEAQHRIVSTPPRLDCQGDLQACPLLRVRVLRVGGPVAAETDWAPLPHAALADLPGPPEGQPLYVARVLEPGLLELMDGKKLRVLGVGAAARGGQGAAAATQRLWDLVMDGPIRLAYDGPRRDASGAWRVHVQLPDGQDLAELLLAEGLVRMDAASAGARQEACRKAESQARLRGLGVWKPQAR
jgi:endonuclease YncB( thermonuclease family)